MTLTYCFRFLTAVVHLVVALAAFLFLTLTYCLRVLTALAECIILKPVYSEVAERRMEILRPI